MNRLIEMERAMMNIKGERFKKAYSEDPTLCHLIEDLLYIKTTSEFEQKSQFIDNQFDKMMYSSDKNDYPSYDTIAGLHHTYGAVKSAKEGVLYKNGR